MTVQDRPGVPSPRTGCSTHNSRLGDTCFRELRPRQRMRRIVVLSNCKSGTIPAMPPRKSSRRRKKPLKLKPRRRGEPDTPGTKPKSYTLPLSVVLEIRNAAATYGSQGRAIQVGSEILTRMTGRLSVPHPRPSSLMRMTYKLAPRTIELIEQLSETDYDNPGQVLAACVKVLKLKKLT